MVVVDERLIFEIALAGWIVYRLVRCLTAGKTSLAREILVSLFFIYACGIVNVTFFPMNIVLYAFDPYPPNLVPLVETIRMLQHTDQPGVWINLLGNLALLAPLGIFLPVLIKPARRAWVTISAGLLISLSIEVTQYLLRFRVSDVDDVIINTLGVTLGFGAFALFSRLPFIPRGLAFISRPERPRRMRSAAAYSLFILVVFLGSYATAIIQQTQTEGDLIAGVSAAHRQLIGTPRFGEYLLVFSQAQDGHKAVEIYRRIFFGRYTSFESYDPLDLQPDTFTVSGTSTSGDMNYFVIARSRREVGAVLSFDNRLPVTSLGEYHFSYTHIPVDIPDAYFSFRFVDRQGAGLPISMEP